MTLTDNDLKELGICAFGARKKMLITIQGPWNFKYDKLTCYLKALLVKDANSESQ